MENTMNQQDRDLLVRLDTKLDSLRSEISEIKGMLTAHDSRIREVEINQGNCKTSLETVKNEMEKLRANSNLKDFILGAGTVLIGILALIFRV